MEKILSSKEMAKRIKANAKLNKKKIKKVVKKIFYYIEMEKIYNSSESESYDSEFWLDVFDEMLKSGMIDIDFLTNLKKYELVESYIKSECSIKSNDISLSGKKGLKEILDNELYTLAGYEDTSIDYSDDMKTLIRIEKYLNKVKKNKDMYQKIGYVFGILLEMVNDYTFIRIWQNSGYGPISEEFNNSESITFRKDDIKNILNMFRYGGFGASLDPNFRAIRYAINSVYEMIKECHPDYFDYRPLIEEQILNVKNENTDDVYDKNSSSTDGEIDTEDVYSKMKRIRIPEYLTYKEFEEYLCSDRVTKYLNPHDFWDMVCRETSYFDYEIKCHLKVFGNICDSFKKYTTSDFLKALKIFHNKIDTLVDYAEYHNTHGRSARQKKYPRKSSQYDELLSMATKGELSPLDISYITGFALRTITIDLNKKSQEK